LTRPIVLLTDFGSRDPFVGIMKCVIETIAKGAVVIDLVHEIAPQDVRAGALALNAALAFLPRDAVVVAVVDPGVGTARRAIAGEANGIVFIGPDNGLLAPALARATTLVEVVEERFFLREVSNTFHGRDVFAPVAAHVASGVPLGHLGPAITSIVSLELPQPSRDSGVIVSIDRYGDAITNIPNAWLSLGMKVFVHGEEVATIASTYGDVAVGAAVAVPSSGGTLEIAINGGSAAESLRLRVGDRVEVR